MENNIVYTDFFTRVKESISNGTFAKLTLAKTVGKPELQNIYVRTLVEENQLKLQLTFKIYKNGLQELVKICDIEEMEQELVSCINNPFLSCLLFTTEADITMKLNKKRIASITEQAPTFKNADPILLEYLNK
ncbi:hypothetical protein [Flavobacterium haoranii]|uniref:Uncharacterized protein n=1 Tax=Flavobacterium haoranii TaxID=683124 RepID=A0A1M6KCM0_9FLAO|nr:hypothetical protein [Flavobacterium haoranii]SHJ56679.1 hypothetical protein SAMN05444337_2249 [Flavobacterium haoranii]